MRATVAASATDEVGNVYPTGSFQNSVSFGSVGLGDNPGNTDAFVAKYSPAAGAFVWTVRGASLGNDAGQAIAVRVRGNALYVSWQTNNPAWSGFTPSGTGNGFVARVNDDGAAGLSLAWAQLAGLVVLPDPAHRPRPIRRGQLWADQ